jgi:GNAT superfamily N-acetyltransferase
VSRWWIADAVAEDAGPLARILGDWVRETGWMPVMHGRDEDAAFVAGLIRDQTVRVALTDAGPVGFLARSCGKIAALYLAPGARGRGIGAALIEDAKRGAGELVLWTFLANRRAIAFYLREGFVEIERGDGNGNDEGLPDAKFGWRQAT